MELAATPTAMTCFSSQDSSVVFLATQRVLSSKQASNSCEVVNKVDHQLNVFFVKNAKVSVHHVGREVFSPC